ncbi:hypothetical protein ACK6TI_24615 [Escherichia coli]
MVRISPFIRWPNLVCHYILIIAELFSEVVTVSQPVPGEEETDITDGIRLSDWYYKYKKSSESNVKDLPE